MNGISATKTAAERNIAKLPELCYTDVATEDVVCIIKKGETGYYRTDWRLSPNDRKGHIDELNAKLKLTPQQVLAMQIGSLVGWHAPGADVDYHKQLAVKKEAR
jgi:uncharacterized ParB-like nuclease family protein